jgi:hypothetical protein
MSEDKNKHPAWNYVDDSGIDPVTKKRVYKCEICGLSKPGQRVITLWASHIVGRPVGNEPRSGIQACTGGPTDESRKAWMEAKDLIIAHEREQNEKREAEAGMFDFITLHQSKVHHLR